jgi:shikimate dehydrogenase
MPYLDLISPEAIKIGAVNTVVKSADGKLYGYNTDYFGFCYMLDLGNIDVSGKKVLVLGRGGASATVCAVLSDRGAREIHTVGSKDNTPEILRAHTDAEIIINATPVGMYPNNGQSPISLSLFPECRAVLDIIYNPSKTALLLQAEELGIKYIGGLSMLVAQAIRAFELFTGEISEHGACEQIIQDIEKNTKNIILIGMPGCGKTTVGKLMAQKLNREFFDADEEFASHFGKSPAEIIEREGEGRFREMEHEILLELGKKSGAVISTGGGAVTKEYNFAPLHQNGYIVFLERELNKLSRKGRPLSASTSLEQLYAQRIDSYRRFSDVCVASTEVPENTADLIIKTLFGEN